MKTSQKGFVGIIIIASLALVVGISIAFYLTRSNKSQMTNVVENKISTPSSQDVHRSQKLEGESSLGTSSEALTQKQEVTRAQVSKSNSKESFIKRKYVLDIPVEFQRNGVTTIEYSNLYGQTDKKTDEEKYVRKQMWIDLADYTLSVARCPKDKENSPSCVLIQRHGDCGFVENIWVKKGYQTSAPTFLDQIRKASFAEFPYVLECY